VSDSGNSNNTNTNTNTAQGGAGGSATGGAANATGGSVGDTSSSSGGNTMTGGDNSASNTSSNAASADGSGNSTTNVDASDHSSFSSQALYLPNIENAAPSIVAGPMLIVDRGQCGPRQEKKTERVQGTYVGIIKRSSIDLGVDDELVDSATPYEYWTDPNGVQHVFGTQVVTFASVNGMAASRSIGIGGGQTGGGWGQGGASSNSSMQRTILRIQLQRCELPLVQRPAPVVLPPVVHIRQ
jgi:hypothetical protein